jgi:ABC-2 type transport system ATP-binding protein
MSERPALEALGISKRYASRDVLCGVDLVAQSGRVHGLLGPNGAGKTTLMRVVLGLVQRDAGTVHLLGHHLDSAPGPMPEGVAGFVEGPSFYPYLSGRQNLELLARLDDTHTRHGGTGIDDALDEVDLGSQADADVGGYSAGMRQRLGLAAALLRSPRLLFLDEPTNAVDPGGARAIRALARRLADEGAAVVLSSHDMAEVEDLCATMTVIDRGHVLFSGAVERLRALAPAAVHVLRTSDDCAAIRVAAERPGLKIVRLMDDSLEVSADSGSLDAYVIALGCRGIAVRALESRVRSLESLFLELTASAAS